MESPSTMHKASPSYAGLSLNQRLPTVKWLQYYLLRFYKVTTDTHLYDIAHDVCVLYLLTILISKLVKKCVLYPQHYVTENTNKKIPIK